MKLLAIVAVALSLSGCGDTDYYKSPADQARDAAWDNAMSTSLLSAYAASPRTCMNIGGIVTCD